MTTPPRGNAVFDTVKVNGINPATLIVDADAGNNSLTIVNTDTVNTVWLGNNDAIRVSDGSGIAPLGPLQAVPLDGTVHTYAITSGPDVQLAVYPGATNFFQPPIINGETLLNTSQLLYAPSVAFGDLTESISAIDTTDPFGASVWKGFTAYVGNNALDLFASFRPGGIFFGTNQNGDAGTGGIFFLAPRTVRIKDILTATDPATGNTVEGWHPMTLDAGWTTLAGHSVPSYRLLASGNVQLSGFAQHAAFSGLVTIASGANALPAAYTPTNAQSIDGIGSGTGKVVVNTSGTVETSVYPAGSTQVEFNGIYPVNL